jgi:hypothetical protein
VGTWGTQPKDNDETEDAFAKVAAASASSVDKLYRASFSRDAQKRWVRLGVLQMFIDGMPAAVAFLDSGTLQAAVYDAEDLLEDNDWLDTWKYGSARSVSSVKASLRSLATRIRHVQLKR